MIAKKTNIDRWFPFLFYKIFCNLIKIFKRCITISEIEITILEIGATFIMWKPFWHYVTSSFDTTKHLLKISSFAIKMGQIAINALVFSDQRNDQTPWFGFLSDQNQLIATWRPTSAIFTTLYWNFFCVLNVLKFYHLT